VLLACCASVSAQESPAEELDLHDLPDAQIESGLIPQHAIGFPSPTELLYVISKESSPKWRKLYYPIPKNHPGDRSKAALRLGLNLTEGHLAAMARDSQKIRDVTTDLERQARTLGIAGDVASVTRRINSLAEAKAWSSVAFEFEALIETVNQLLEKQRDHDLKKFLTVGAMVRLLHLSSGVVSEKDFSDTTHAISNHWTLQQLAILSTPSKDNPDETLASVHEQIAKLERMWHPDKLLHGHKFDDQLIAESNHRLTIAIGEFTH